MSWNPTPKIPKNLFEKRKDQEFVGLVQATLEDETICQYFFTLRAPPRLSQLQKSEIELEQEQEQEQEQEHPSKPLISAIEFLKDTDIASRTPYTLNKKIVYKSM